MEQFWNDNGRMIVEMVCALALWFMRSPRDYASKDGK
jgi:hypothetical protein